jgi:hypothetical protein
VNVVETIATLDENTQLHTARILLLLDAFAEDQHSPEIEGLTKLAKLDFLLRYPVMLERALAARNKSTREVELQDYERHSVESAMVRYRFGPWDHRYRHILNLLVARGLAATNIDGRKVTIVVTQRGREVARQLAQKDTLATYVARARVLKRHFDLTATNLVRFIYDTFPEVVSLRSNASIPT